MCNHLVYPWLCVAVYTLPKMYVAHESNGGRVLMGSIVKCISFGLDMASPADCPSINDVLRGIYLSFHF